MDGSTDDEADQLCSAAVDGVKLKALYDHLEDDLSDSHEDHFKELTLWTA